MYKNILQILVLLFVTIGLCTDTFALPSPWSIAGIAVEKWGNGSIKRAMRAKGSFPISSGLERPTWYVNDSNVGMSDVFFQYRTVYGGESLQDKAMNTVTLRFTKAPYAGASSTIRFYFDSSRVPAGGSAWFGATLAEKEVVGETSSGRPSDNLLLQLPEELRTGVIPAPVPDAGVFTVSGADANMVVIDLETRLEETVPPAAFSVGQAGDEPLRESPSFGGGLTLEANGTLPAEAVPARPEVVIGADDRVRDKDPMHFPEHTIVKIYSRYPQSSTTTYICSGAMIASSHVLTSAHCVYDKNMGGWATSVKVVPALQGSYMPYGSANAVKLMSFDLFLNNQDVRHDLAVVKINKALGNSTGWMGRETAGSGHSMYAFWHIVEGYPAEKDGGLKMWWHQKKNNSADEYLLYYQIDTTGGQSGSPVWSWPVNYDDGPWYIHGVHRGGTSSQNVGVRLNKQKYDAVKSFIADRAILGTGSGPDEERAQLIDDGQAYAGFSPANLPPGGGELSVWTGVRNIGAAAVDAYTVSFYASRDASITRNDHLLGTVTGSRLEPFAHEDLRWEGVLPQGMTEGLYYVGWIITAPDGTETSSCKELSQLQVSSLLRAAVNHPPGMPEPVSPAQGDTVSAGEVVFSWKGSSDPDGDTVRYRLLYSRNASFMDGTTVNIETASREGASLWAAGAFPLSLGFFALLFCGGETRRTRGMIMILLTVATLVSVLGLNACSSSSSSKSASLESASVESASVVTHRVQGLTAGSVYYWKVIAEDGNGGVSESVRVGFQTE